MNINISYPQPNFKIETRNNGDYIFDTIRKKWILLTPEEWVRQNFIAYLVQVLQCPPALIAIEKTIKVGETKKRFDIVVYKNEKAWMIVECKQLKTPINAYVLQQAIAYYSTIQSQFMVLSNGNDNYVWQKLNHHLVACKQMPAWE